MLSPHYDHGAFVCTSYLWGLRTAVAIHALYRVFYTFDLQTCFRIDALYFIICCLTWLKLDLLLHSHKILKICEYAKRWDASRRCGVQLCSWSDFTMIWTQSQNLFCFFFKVKLHMIGRCLVLYKNKDCPENAPFFGMFVFVYISLLLQTTVGG